MMNQAWREKRFIFPLSFSIHPSAFIPHPSKQPRLRRTPIAPHGHQRNPQHLTRFLKTQSTKIPPFDHTTLALIESCQFIESQVQRNEFRGAMFGHEGSIFDRDLSNLASMLYVTTPPRVVDQNVAHHLR